MARSLALPLAAAVAVLSSALPSRADPSAPAASAPAASAPAAMEGTVAVMRARAQAVHGLLRAARKHGSAATVACLDDALSRSDTALRRVRELRDEVDAAATRGDRTGARAALARAAEWREAQRLAAERARACATPAQPVAAGPDATSVRVSIDAR
jgi:hypothetical protein